MKGMKIIPQSEKPGTFVHRGNLEASSELFTHMLFFNAYTAQGLTDLSNGFMRDDRVFHINQPNWIEMYNQQGDLMLASLVERY